MKFVIFNFNMKFETSEIYSRLIADGVNATDIIIADNGSDDNEIHFKTRFRTPKNIRFIGQSFLLSSYLLNFEKDQEFVYITTSATLNAGHNYRDCITEVVNKNNNWGFISASFNNDIPTSGPSHLQHVSKVDSEFSEVFIYQPVFLIISRRLLEKCYDDGSAYFNLALNRGWGLDFELQYTANIHGMRNFISKNLQVGWMTNAGHKQGKMDESLDSYQNHAYQEMDSVFSKRYGIDWKSIFFSEFKNIKYKKNLFEYLKLVVKKTKKSVRQLRF
jgi:hypothetical protein